MTGEQIAWTILAACALSISYMLHCVAKPWRDHPPCKGSGKHRSSWWNGTLSVCKGCGGKGRVLRVGTKLIKRFANLPHWPRG